MSSDVTTKSVTAADKDYALVTQEQGKEDCCRGAGDGHEHGGDAKRHGRGLGHMAMMIVCCGAPILLLALVPVILRVNPAFGAFLSRYAVFLCPLMMIFMVPMMLKGGKHKH